MKNKDKLYTFSEVIGHLAHNTREANQHLFEIRTELLEDALDILINETHRRYQEEIDREQT